MNKKPIQKYGRFSKSCDRGKLLEIFPNEVWKSILAKIKDADMLQTLYFTTGLFKDLMEEERCRFLFPTVIRLIINGNYLKKNQMKRILLCRRACHIWRKAVDQTLESRAFNDKFTRITYYRPRALKPHRVQRVRISSFFGDPAYRARFKIDEFDIEMLNEEVIPALRNLQFGGNSPFPSRYLEYLDRDMSEEERTAAFEVLQLSGHHFHHAEIEANASNLVQWSERVTSLVGLLPNLKTLKLELGHTRDNVNNELLRLQNATEDLPFPSLHNLEMIVMEKLPACITNAILGKNPFVRTLEVLDLTYRDTILEINAQISPFRVNFCIKAPQELDSLSDDWKLKGLKLDIERLRYGIKSEPYVLEHVFQKVLAYQTTLEELQLILPVDPNREGDVDTTVSNEKLELPNLKRLFFRSQPSCSLDFILGMSSLERLRIEHLWTPGPTLDFTPSNIKSTPRSNIWNLLPNLKEIEARLSPEDGYTKFRRPKSIEIIEAIRYLFIS